VCPRAVPLLSMRQHSAWNIVGLSQINCMYGHICLHLQVCMLLRHADCNFRQDLIVIATGGTVHDCQLRRYMDKVSMWLMLFICIGPYILTITMYYLQRTTTWAALRQKRLITCVLRLFHYHQLREHSGWNIVGQLGLSHFICTR